MLTLNCYLIIFKNIDLLTFNYLKLLRSFLLNYYSIIIENVIFILNYLKLFQNFTNLSLNCFNII
jgi:hypothetical protein